MVPRKRSPANRDLPPNLYANGNGYKYRRPDNRKEAWMGVDKAKAIAAAKKLNAMLVKGGDLVSKVLARETVADAISVFRQDDMPSRKWSRATAEGHEITLRRIEAGLGAVALGDLTVKACAEFIRAETESVRSRQNIRMVLGWVLACAVEEGWIDHNPAEATRKFSYERKRERLTLEAYKAIHAQAPAWLQNAMDVSLLTLLRREDVVSARFADVRDGALWIVPSKTEGSTGTRLKFALTPALSDLLARCRDAVVSPYLIHRLPDRARPSDKRARDRVHHTQVLPEQLSRAFADARDAAGVGGDHPPTFHEIRSLGGALLIEQGWTLPQVQALMGHASEAMTQVYLDGHQQPWAEVAPGLSLG